MKSVNPENHSVIETSVIMNLNDLNCLYFIIILYIFNYFKMLPLLVSLYIYIYIMSFEYCLLHLWDFFIFFVSKS